MTESSDTRLVIAFFESPLAAESALGALQEQAVRHGRRGTVGILSLDGRGRVDTDRLGDRSAEDGPGVGAVLGAIALTVAGDSSLLRDDLFDLGSILSLDDIARYGAELEAGETAIAVLEPHRESDHAVVQLAELGGRAEIHRLPRSDIPTP